MRLCVFVKFVRLKKTMNLIIDQGNTNIKFFLFSDNKIKKNFIFSIKKIDFNFLNDFNINSVIYSSVSGEIEHILKLSEKKNFIKLSVSTKLPIKNLYKSATIGLDRLAAVTGACKLFPDKNILIIDVGSAITFDFISSKKEYHGGNISPGLKLRYKALNNYTKNLPLLEPENNNVFLANNTKDAIIAGVQLGLLFEIEKYIENLNKLNRNFLPILTGGDAEYFEKKIKYPIFAQPNLVAIGLNEILNFNIEKN